MLQVGPGTAKKNVFFLFVLFCFFTVFIYMQPKNSTNDTGKETKKNLDRFFLG